MNKIEATRMILNYMNEYLPNDWNFKWSHSRTTLGSCIIKGQGDCVEKTIVVSIPYIEVSTEDDVRDTILHEIAHALNHERNYMDGIYLYCSSHGEEWKQICAELGCRPERTSRVSHLKPKYQYVCPECDRIVAHRTKRIGNHAWYKCRKCGSSVRDEHRRLTPQ